MLRLCTGMLLAALAAEEGLTVVRPGDAYATFRFEGLEVHVPAAQAEALRGKAGQAAAIYRRLLADARYQPRYTLHLALVDDQDVHNGFSTTVPFPLIQVLLAPAPPESALFAGEDGFARTLVHELTHHIGNDRSQGGRSVVERIFGRVLPNDPLSLLVFFASTPQHITQPIFWHEGTAQWAETAYADAASPWAGRGRDSLVHMIWRLDAAGEGIPAPDAWRLSHPRWPFGSQAYHYGLAYTRWLAARQPDLWRVLERQGAADWPFAFDEPGRDAIGQRHGRALATAVAELQAEQQRNLAILRSQPGPAIRRLTLPDWRWGAPAWDGDDLILAGDAPQGTPHVVRLDRDGRVRDRGGEAWALGGLRAAGPGRWVRADVAAGGQPWSRARIALTDAALRDTWLPGERLVQPTADAEGTVVAVQFRDAGQQALVRWDGARWHDLPTNGRPWSPALRPGTEALAWVETDAAGSRLVLGDRHGGDRRVLWQVRGRLLHPVWAGDGLFVCADHTGVANAWFVPLAGEPRPVTNTIGGVVACVPSPDGRELAVIDHDQRGPFVARIANDPAQWATQVPQIDLAWPAPGTQAPPAPPELPSALPATDPAPYDSFAALRPRFWTPTFYAVPEGGFGAVGVATDPLLRDRVVVGAGVGFHEHTPVGLVSWASDARPLSLAAVAWRAELGWDEQIFASDGRFHDYTERVDTIEVRAGRGLAGLRRRWQAYVAAGWADHQQVERNRDEYLGLSTSGPEAFAGSERYVEATLAYSGALLFPTSYAREDGPSITASYRLSGLGGDYTGSQAQLLGTWVQPVIPTWGHQALVYGQLGWSDGPITMQGRYGTGGDAAQGTPRGYRDTLARGRNLVALGGAYRLPLWRPFDGVGTSPLVWRQVVAEVFYEGAQVADDRPDGEGRWFRSAGVELHLDLEFSLIRLAPGFGLARQIDYEESTTGYASLGFRW